MRNIKYNGNDCEAPYTLVDEKCQTTQTTFFLFLLDIFTLRGNLLIKVAGQEDFKPLHMPHLKYIKGQQICRTMEIILYIADSGSNLSFAVLTITSTLYYFLTCRRVSENFD